MKIKLNLTIAFFTIIILIPSLSRAQTYTALEPLPCIPGGGIQASDCPGGVAGSIQKTFNFRDYVQYIFNLIIAIAAAAAVFMIVYGGLLYMTTDSWQNKSEGLDKAKNAVYGLLLVLASFLILRTIDPRLVAIPTTLVPPLKIQPPPTIGSYVDALLTPGQSTSLAAYLAENPQARAQIAELQTNVQAATTQKAEKETLLRNLAARHGLGTNIAAICAKTKGELDAIDSELWELCDDIRIGTDNIGTFQGQIITEAGKAVIVERLKTCFAATFSVSECKTRIDEALRVTQSRMAEYSQPPQVINDYATFAKTMLDIYAALKAYNPAVEIPGSSLLRTFLPSAGYTLAAVQWLKSGKSADSTIARITSIVNSASISDPALKAELASLLNALKQSMNPQ